MSYLEEITAPLTKVLSHHAQLPASQLAGHAANVDFWMAEVAHRLMVIDGYQKRFKAMREAQLQHPGAHGVVPPPQRSTSDEDRKTLARDLRDAAHSLLDRLEREALIDQTRAQELRKKLAT